MNSLSAEVQLCEEIRKLQEYRSNGITTLRGEHNTKLMGTISISFFCEVVPNLYLDSFGIKY